jgi:hypothetical protein
MAFADALKAIVAINRYNVARWCGGKTSQGWLV